MNIVPPARRAAACVLAALLLAPLLLAAGCGSSPAPAPVPPVPPYLDVEGAANPQNLGLTAYGNGWLYYSFVVFDTKTMATYRVPSDGNGEPQRISDHVVTYLSVQGSRLYYVRLIDSTNRDGLFRSALDGTGEELVLAIDDVFHDLAIRDGFAYYVAAARGVSPPAGPVYRYAIDADGAVPQRLGTDEAETIGVGDGFVFYEHASEFQLYRMALDGSGRTLVWADAVGMAVPHRGKLFLLAWGDTNAIVQADLDGTHPFLMVDGSGPSLAWMNVYDDHVYYSRWGFKENGAKGVFRVKTGTTAVEPLMTTLDYNRPLLNISASKVTALNLVPWIIGEVPISYFRMNTDGSDLQVLWEAQ